MKEKIFERIEKAFFSKSLKYALLNNMKKAGIEMSLYELFTKLYLLSYALTVIVLVYVVINIFESKSFGILNFIITDRKSVV